MRAGGVPAPVKRASDLTVGRAGFRFHFRRRNQLNRPIRVRAAARCAVMPGDEIDGRGLGSSAAVTAQAAEKILKGHIAVAFDQQPHGVQDRTASAMQAMQLDHALGPVREPVRPAEEGRCIPHFWIGTEREQERG
jgi:hypothetical protein